MPQAKRSPYRQYVVPVLDTRDSSCHSPVGHVAIKTVAIHAPPGSRRHIVSPFEPEFNAYEETMMERAQYGSVKGSLLILPQCTTYSWMASLEQE